MSSSHVLCKLLLISVSGIFSSHVRDPGIRADAAGDRVSRIQIAGMTAKTRAKSPTVSQDDPFSRVDEVHELVKQALSI